MEITGIAHIQLTVNDLQRAMPFYEKVLGFMGMKAVVKAPIVSTMIGGRTGVAITRSSEENRKYGFDQRRIGLHHICFRARQGTTSTPYMRFSRTRSEGSSPAEEGSWALATTRCFSKIPKECGWRPTSFPERGIFEHPEQLPLKTMPGYENYPA